MGREIIEQKIAQLASDSDTIPPHVVSELEARDRAHPTRSCDWLQSFDRGLVARRPGFVGDRRTRELDAAARTIPAGGWRTSATQYLARIAATRSAWRQPT